MMKWRIGEVTVTKIVELEVTGGQPVHPAAGEPRDDPPD